MFNFLSSQIQTTPLIISAVGLIALIVLLAIFLDSGKKGFDTKMIAFAGISIALSISLSLVKIFKMPQGGSITLASLLPLLLFAYIYGTKKGIFVGTIVGLLNFFTDPYFVHPAQFLLDYLVAYAAIGLAGCFSKIKIIKNIPQLDFTLGAIFACCVRYVCHVLSGVFAFSEFATTEVWIYSLGYNSFVFVDLGIAVAVGIIAMFSKPFLKIISTMKNPPKKVSDGRNSDDCDNGSNQE